MVFNVITMKIKWYFHAIWLYFHSSLQSLQLTEFAPKLHILLSLCKLSSTFMKQNIFTDKVSKRNLNEIYSLCDTCIDCKCGILYGKVESAFAWNSNVVGCNEKHHPLLLWLWAGFHTLFEILVHFKVIYYTWEYSRRNY